MNTKRVEEVAIEVNPICLKNMFLISPRSQLLRLVPEYLDGRCSPLIPSVPPSLAHVQERLVLVEHGLDVVRAALEPSRPKPEDAQDDEAHLS